MKQSGIIRLLAAAPNNTRNGFGPRGLAQLSPSSAVTVFALAKNVPPGIGSKSHNREEGSTTQTRLILDFDHRRVPFITEV